MQVARAAPKRLDGRMLEFLKPRGRADRPNGKRNKTMRGKAAVTFAARLTFEDVSRSFGDMVALDHVSLDVAPGEVLCLLGPSGCGKTTLLRIAAGVERPTGGRVLLDEQEVAGAQPLRAAGKTRRGLDVPGLCALPASHHPRQCRLRLRSLSRAEAKAEALAALQRVGLAHCAHEYPHILSGGEQQRVALARAIAPRPSVVLMDEPFSGLDSRLRESMREETLAILHETHATAIIVTHDAEEAMRMGDRVALLRKGRVVQTGSALDLYRAPKDILAARTFSDLNEIAARIEQGSAATPLGTVCGRWTCRGRRRHRLRAAAWRAAARGGAGGAGARARCALSRRRGAGRGRGAGARCSTARPRARGPTCRLKARRSAYRWIAARCLSSPPRTARRRPDAEPPACGPSAALP